MKLVRIFQSPDQGPKGRRSWIADTLKFLSWSSKPEAFLYLNPDKNTILAKWSPRIKSWISRAPVSVLETERPVFRRPETCRSKTFWDPGRLRPKRNTDGKFIQQKAEYFTTSGFKTISAQRSSSKRKN